MGKIERIFTTQNENCVNGYLAACTQPRWPNQVGSLDFWCSGSLQFLYFILPWHHLWINPLQDVLSNLRKKVSLTRIIYYQFGYVILKMVVHKKQDFWPKINILKGNLCILRIRVVPVRQKLGIILENKVVQKLKIENKTSKIHFESTIFAFFDEP